MKCRLLNPLTTTLAAVILLIVGLAAYSPTRAGIFDFLQRKDSQVVQFDSSHAASQAPGLNPALAPPPGEAPNYRAIVRQWRPAVVGVTVEGTHRVAVSTSPGFDDDWSEGGDTWSRFAPRLDGHPTSSADLNSAPVRVR